MKKYPVLLLMLTLWLVACTSGKKPIPEDWNKLEKAEFSVQYPQDWIMDATGINGAVFFLRTKLQDSTDRFTENINLMIQNLEATPMDLDQFVALAEQQIRDYMTESQILESGRITVNGQAFHRVRFNCSQGSFRLMMVQYYTVVGKKAYVMTLTCEERTYRSFLPTGEQIMGSFIVR